MPPEEDGDGYFAALTTAPIFDDAIYHTEGLELPEWEGEHVLDEQLSASARACGIHDPDRYLCPETYGISTAISTLTVDSARASSISVHSRETQSTGMTSHPSRTSRDSPHVEPHSSMLRTPPVSRGLHSSDYDSVMDRFRPQIGHRHSSSNTSYTNSMLSATSSLSKPIHKRRSSGLFSMFRRDSSCSSRSHPDRRHGKPSTPKLDCGHSLSEYGIRVHIEEALRNKSNYSPPACCRIPLPRAVLETVLTPRETDLVLLDNPHSPAYTIHRDSGFSEQDQSSVGLSQSPESMSPRTGSFIATPINADLTPEDQEKLERALESETFADLKRQQKEQMQRVSEFELNQGRALASYYEWSFKQLDVELETMKQAATKRHPVELEKLDESQIIAEHEMRRAQAQESQNVATALKYMEAYCAGSSPTNPGTAHIVTEEDRKKLARQYLTRDKLPQKHESAINVLRARQEKDLKAKLQKQQGELQQLDAEYEERKLERKLQYISDSSELDSVIQSRRTRFLNRWELRLEIWRREWEAEHDTTLRGQIPQEIWPDTESDAGPIAASSSLALFTRITA